MSLIHPTSPVSSPSYFKYLNPEQRRAVETLDGPVLVLAGAGTGKTRVLTTRIAHLLHEGKAFAGQILAVTFTNKAAREMGERVAQLLGGVPEDGAAGSGLRWLGTFHAIGAKILRRHAELVGLKSNFTILNEDDQIRVIKSILNEKNLDEKQHPPRQMLDIIQSWKDEGLLPEKVGSQEKLPRQKALLVYQSYQTRLKTLNAADFGDLLLHNLTIFTTHHDILEEYSRRFKYILVDEYQDTNIAQYLWLRLLAYYHKNICCVGDDDQSIYGWRGAEVGNILKFEHDFPGAVIIRLERNYRSTQPILSAASHLIAHNQSRLGKTLWTEEKVGEKIQVANIFGDDREEARFAAQQIDEMQRSRKLREIAVLVRTGAQTRAFEEQFMAFEIPYRVIGGLRFYERLEIRDAIAYLRLISQPEDDLAFERIVNTPKRGAGKAALAQMHHFARSHQMPLYQAVQQLIATGEIKGKLAAALKQLFDHFTAWRNALQDTPLPEVTERMLEESGYLAMWQEEKTDEAQGRVENLCELVRALGEFESLEAFLEHVSLVMDADDRIDRDYVSVMTLHAAKGLEFECVFLPGWEEGLFPHQRAMDESGAKGVEEERRLAYVGLTRAKRCIFITHPTERRFFTKGGIDWQPTLPSRFLSELPESEIEVIGGALYGKQKISKAALAQEIAKIMASTRTNVTPLLSSKHSAYQIGARIFHQKFGYGKIIGAHGDHLDIEFDKAGRKKVMADFVTAA